MKYHNIVWDMGGTLMDTYPSVDRTLAHVVTLHGTPMDPAEVARLTRRSIGHAIEELSTRHRVPRQALEEAYADLKRSWAETPPPVMAGARDVMAFVHGSGGLNVVVTHRDRTSATALLRATGLAIDDMICAPDGYPRKPDPTMYRVLLERSGLDPADCLAVGDRAIDAEAAGQAGVAAVLLETPGIPVAGQGPRITGLHQVVALLEGDQPSSPST